MEEHLFQVTAVLSSNTAGGSFNTGKLMSDMRACCKEVERALSNRPIPASSSSAENIDNIAVTVQQVGGNSLIDEFREQTLVRVLLSCPCVREHPCAGASTSLCDLVTALPSTADNVFYIIVRGLSYQAQVYPLMALLPTSITLTIMNTCLKNPIKTVQPAMLSFVAEISKAYIFSLQFQSEEDNVQAMSSLMLPALKTYANMFDNKVPMNAALTFLHLLDLLYHTSSVVVGQLIKKTLSSDSYAVFKDAFNIGMVEETWKMSKDVSSSLLETAVEILALCQTTVQKIDVNTWLSWSEVEPSDTFYCMDIARLDKSAKLTAQLLISYVASFVLKTIDSKSNDVHNCKTDDANLVTYPAKEKLEAEFSKHTELKAFLKQIKIDPLHDPDKDLPLEEIVSLLRDHEHQQPDVEEGPSDSSACDATMSTDKRGKLFRYLIEWPHRKELFCSEDSAELLSDNMMEFTEDQAESVLRDYFKTDAASESVRWKMVLVEASRGLKSSTIRDVLLLQLQRTNICYDWLITPVFFAHLTAVCNTLVSRSTEGHDELDVSRESGGVWWVCMQRPACTIGRLVHMAVNTSGVAVQTAALMRNLAPICRAKSEGSKLSLLSCTLEEYMSRTPPKLENSKQEEAFIKFFTALCKEQAESNTTKGKTDKGGDNEGPMLVSEVLHELIVRKLVWLKNKPSLHDAAVLCPMLQALVEHLLQSTINCIKPREIDVSILLVMLVIMLNNTQGMIANATTAAADHINASESARIEPSVAVNRFNDCCSNVQMGGRAPFDVKPTEGLSSADLQKCVSVIRCLQTILRILVQYLMRAPEYRMDISRAQTYLQRKNLCHLPCMNELKPLLDQLASDDAEKKVKNALSKKAKYENAATSGGATSKTPMTRIQHTFAYFKELHNGLPEDWVSACDRLRRLQTQNKGVLHGGSEEPVAVLGVLRDVLQLLCHARAAGARVNTLFCYRNFNTAAAHFLKEESNALNARAASRLLCSVFEWWCRYHIRLTSSSAASETTDSGCIVDGHSNSTSASAVDEIGVRNASDSVETATNDNTSLETGVSSSSTEASDLTSVLLIRVLDLVREIGVTKQLLNTEPSIPVTVKNTGSHFAPEAVVSCIDDEVNHINNQNGSTSSDDSGDNKCNKKGKQKRKSGLTRKEFRFSVKKLIEPFLKYSTHCPLSATVATKLNSLLES